MKHFKESEFECNGEPCFDKMNKSFIKKLDYARSLSSVPFQITSSWRSKEHNEKVGGSPVSSHLIGVAVDIWAFNGRARFEIVKALTMAGFKRIGVSSNFIHVDMDLDKDQNVMWLY